MSYSVQWSLDMIYGQSVVVAVVDTDPPESNRLQFPLQLWINADCLSILVVDERSSDLGAVVMLPQIFT